MEHYKDKIRKLTRAVIFVCLFCLLFILLSGVLASSGSSSEDGMESRITRAYRGEDRDSLDVIFAGNSDLYRGISPVDLYHDTGITSAVAGRPGNTLAEISADIDDILKYQSPRMLVLETDCMFSDRNPGHKSGHSEKPSLFRKIKSAVDNADSAITTAINYYFPLMKYHDRWKELRPSSFFTRSRDFYSFRNKGMAYSGKVLPYNGGSSYMDADTGSRALSAENEAAFNDILKKCTDNSMELVLMTVPSANTWNKAKSEAVKELAVSHGLCYYDYNADFPEGFDWTLHTTDGGNHLNYAGAVKVTADFALRLTHELRLPKSLLTPAQSEQWQRDYETFHDAIDSSSR